MVVPVVPIAQLLVGIAFWFLFYSRYWKWRECIEMAASSCVTPEGDNLIGGGAFWSVPASVFTMLGAVRFVLWARAR